MKEGSARKATANITNSSTGDNSYDAALTPESRQGQKIEFAGLHEELKSLIFSFLPPGVNLANAQQVSKNWNELINQKFFWQRKIQEDFPYLMQNQKEDFDNNPRALYIKQKTAFEKFSKYEVKTSADGSVVPQSESEAKFFSKLTMKRIFSSIRGEFKEIEENTELEERHRNLFYALAVAHGHYQALSKLRAASGGLRCAASIGNLNAVKHILEAATNISTEDKTSALNEAAIEGHLKILNYLLDVTPEITNQNIGDALYFGSKHGKFEVVKFLLEEKKDKISARSLGYALLAACSGYPNIVMHLLKERATDISVTKKDKALLEACEYKQIECVKHLLEHASDILMTKWTAFGIAINKNCPEIVQLILEDGNIPLDLKRNGLKNAKIDGFVGIVDVITQSIDKDISGTPSPRM